MDQINRMAVIVFLREPFIDWINSLNPDNPVWMGSLTERGNVYLIPECEDIDAAEEHIEDIFDEIFTNELTEWQADKSLWPVDRHYDMFLEWFDLVYDVAVFDTSGDSDGNVHN